MAETVGASSVHIPDKGWFLFGGNSLNTSQKLMNIDSNWEQGPEVQTVNQYGQCAVQVIIDQLKLFNIHELCNYLNPRILIKIMKLFDLQSISLVSLVKCVILS
jgi:hypothetical protein